MRQGFSSVVAGIGELLWDIFPEGRKLGGAPVNFAGHCRGLGARAFPISRVGEDASGEEMMKRLADSGLPLDLIQFDPEHSTGRVEVQLDEAGKPGYEIAENVAWDHIKMTSSLLEKVSSFDAICFGSLAQRLPVSRATIQRTIDLVPEERLKIFDINLRYPFYSKTLIEQSLALANVLKLSDEELPVLAAYFGLSGEPEKQLSELLSRFALRLIAYTRGDNGSLLITEDGSDDFFGEDIEVVDTVGAGDAFTAALCLAVLNGFSLAETNRYATRVAEYVCTQSGAVPPLPADFVIDQAKRFNSNQKEL